MKTKLLAVIFLIVFLSSPLYTQAQSRIVDNAGILSAGEIAELQRLAETIAANYSFDLVIVTEKDIGVPPENYADDFFDNNGYGLGEDRDGCLFLRVTGSRDYWFGTSGRGIKILNSAAFNKLDSTVAPYLENNAYAGAFRAFINEWETFLALDASGRSYNIFYKYNIILVVIAWVLSLLIGLAVVLSWKKQMDTALVKEQADSFIIPGSLAFTKQEDRFLYSRVTKIARPKSTSSGSSGVHRSSSGRRHGGGGGRR
jgi:uncharacterized protein